MENAVKIFESGKLLSALHARNVPVEQLMNEKRNAANAPADYFEYIMLSWGNCQAGENAVFDGVLPMKVKDEINLYEWLYAAVIPTELKGKMEEYVPHELKERIIYIENDCKDIWEWSEKVYSIIENTLETKKNV